jgi:hypothetical protein
MEKFTLVINSCYLVTFTDGSMLKFVFLGNSPEYPETLIETDGERFLFKDKIAEWISIEKITCD